jgi:hypothetical protein
MWEEVAKQERDEHFNDIRLVILMKQEWRVTEKANTHAPMTFNDDMYLLDDDEAPLIKDGSPPPTSMDIEMVFSLSAEFKGAKEEVVQMCLDPKEVVFGKPKELSQHLKSLHILGHIDGKPICRMLIDSGAAVNLMSYSMFKKFGRQDGKLVKTNLMLNDMGGGGATQWRLGVSSPRISP